MIRRFGAPPDPNRRYKMRPGAYAILQRGPSVLLTFQRQPEPEFQLPGGGIDPGESPIQTLHREVYEETGWHIGSPRKLGAFRRFTYMPEYDLWAEKLCHIYVARPVMRLSEPLEPDHSVVWMDPELAADAVYNDGDRVFLRRYFD
ncbi:NUDIX hydrolase [Tateyamaria omphalii]|uniref:NUDIX hydrolase n=1 Tax=Tateyamaria omphalii TaxID=299262 RepID=A0A1P8MYU3_9RHOB|nr:NUDIX hydrolase [Tateyamaria omphalii]APX13132.1 NUDIX hydrolase [Tateyamaria omphalii]